MEEWSDLLKQEWIRCPHCGIRNETKAETCFFCGKAMQAASGGEAAAATAAVIKTAAPVQTAEQESEPAENGEIRIDSDAPDDFPEEADAPKRLRRPMKPWQRVLCWGVGVTAGLLLLGASAAQFVYMTSPAHDAMLGIRQQWYVGAHNIYSSEVHGRWPHAQIMDREVRAYLAEMDAMYRADRMALSEYAERVSATLQEVYDDPPAYYAQQQAHFQSLMDGIYEDYMAAEPKITLNEAQAAFQVLMNHQLHTESEQQVRMKYDAMTAMSVSRRNYETALTAEEGERYETAIQYYRQVIEADAWYAEAQTRLQRCENTYRRQILDKVNGAKPVNSAEIQPYITMLANGLKILPADAELSAAIQQQRMLFAKTRKREVLALVKYETNYFSALSNLQEALGYEQNTGDPELTAELNRVWKRARAHLMANLRKNMETGAWVNTNALWTLLEIREDAELRTLYNQFTAYESHALCYFANWAGEYYTPGVKNMYWNEADEDPNVKKNIAPVKDAFGNMHDPFNLWRFSANLSQITMLTVSTNEEMQRFSFMIIPAASCGSGTAYLQIRTSFNDGSKVLYTSPKLTRNSTPVRVELALDNVHDLDIKLIAESTPDGQPVEMLIDGGWIESSLNSANP